MMLGTTERDRSKEKYIWKPIEKQMENKEDREGALRNNVQQHVEGSRGEVACTFP